ncbi:extracellular solute-binding protein [Paenibacillus sp. CC-CFT747]|nr:extracellular solute-binding protein [Paenibacillus sp. CC-CFT747]
MKNKKWLSMLVTLGMLAGILSACKDSNSAGDTAKGDVGGSAASVSEAGKFPIVAEKTNLRVMIGANPAVENFDTNAFTKYFEDLTNIHVEWEIVPASTGAEKLNIALASGDLPDVIMTMNVTPEQQALYGEQEYSFRSTT